MQSGQFCGRSLMWSVNKTGPITLPWMTPLLTSPSEDSELLTFTTWLLRKDLSHLSVSWHTPIDASFLSKSELGATSKALVKSMSPTSTTSPTSRARLQSWWQSNICAHVLRPGKKPYWLLEMILLDKANCKRLSRIIVSIILQMVQVREIGLKLLTILGSPFFSKRRTTARFQSSGMQEWT